MVLEVKSPDILSPAPSVITHGLVQVAALVACWHDVRAITEQ